MKTNIGGDRLGSGSKQEVSVKHYNRSTHDLSGAWRSSMSCGTLVPFMTLPALPGDSFDIDLACEVITLPTLGPLFGSFKVQLDVFQIPIRCYNAMLHMNRTEIGNDMSSVLLPQIKVNAIKGGPEENPYEDNIQINPSSLLKYLGISGIGNLQGIDGVKARDFNAIDYLGYFDIYKNYYANKQEEEGVVIHIDNDNLWANNAIIQAYVKTVAGNTITGNCLGANVNVSSENAYYLDLKFGADATEPKWQDILFQRYGVQETLGDNFNTGTWNNDTKSLVITDPKVNGSAVDWQINIQNAPPLDVEAIMPQLVRFPLSNIDDMRMAILQHTPQTNPFIIDDTSPVPYSHPMKYTGTADNDRVYATRYPMENLAIKTYQSDLFNNWISTEWLDGANGVNAVTAVDTTGDSFTIDSLNLAQKVYVMLNRIAVSGGSYDDWLDAVYEHERPKSMESPLYHGSLIKELAFEEVISNAATSIDGVEQPLGELGGRGRLTQKNKGGRMKIKVHEPSYLMGIVSLTPRIEYSQGNLWDKNLKTMNDFHKPALDGIGFQELITDQMTWQSSELDSLGNVTYTSAGKQPAWINYMTEVNRCYGNFADENKDMFMVLNRKYQTDETTGDIEDLTTYIDPTKFNNIFAQTTIDAQNFWVHIGKKITARRKMSAKIIPNL